MINKNIDKDTLVEILKKLDEKIKKKVVLIAIGGTGLNLLGLKKSTEDVDFIIESTDNLLKAELIVEIYKLGYETQIQDKGTIVLYRLPADYVENSLPCNLDQKFKNLTIVVLSPLDILISKIGRYELKDRTDISQILGRYKYQWPVIEARFKEFHEQYKGNKPNFLKNFQQFKEQYDTLFPK